jgi:hypothetical protein
MSAKGTIRRTGSFVVGTPEETDRNFRKSVIAQQWHNYQVTNDLECLAQICEHADYYGEKSIGPALARTLRNFSRKAKGYEAELQWELALRLYELLSSQPDWAQQTGQAKRWRVAEILEIREADREKWQDTFRKQIRARSQRP